MREKTVCNRQESPRFFANGNEKQAFFDRSSAEDWAFHEYSDEKHRKLDRFLDLAGVEKGNRVLEPGCGTGRFTIKLSGRVGPDGEVVAVDTSPKMVEACRLRVGKLPNVRILRTPVQNIPFPPRCFDVVFCLCVFPHFDDKVETLRFFNRVLRSSGVLAVAHTQGSRILNQLHRKLGGPVEGDRIPPYQEMRRIFVEAGFRIDAFFDRDDGYLLRAGIEARKKPWKDCRWVENVENGSA